MKVHGYTVKTIGSSNEILVIGKSVRKVITKQWCGVTKMFFGWGELVGRAWGVWVLGLSEHHDGRR